MTDIDISDQLEHFDFERITRWLAASYWSPGISQAAVEKGARSSTVVSGAFCNGQQIAFARVVSDTTRFAYVCDVIVDETFRQQGIATRLMDYLLHHPRLTEVEHWYLITRDAQAVYTPLGFQRYNPPDRTVMVLHR